LEIDVVIGHVTGIVPGVYRYQPTSHTLLQTNLVDVRKDLGKAALNQNWLADGSAVFVLAAVYERTTVKYGDRGFRYVQMDVAFAAANLHLQAVADGLGTVVIGAFDDDEVHSVVNLKVNERPLLILPVGWPA
jgi:SagB-type dehydrogenase family enzyme